MGKTMPHFENYMNNLTVSEIEKLADEVREIRAQSEKFAEKLEDETREMAEEVWEKPKKKPKKNPEKEKMLLVAYIHVGNLSQARITDYIEQTSAGMDFLRDRYDILILPVRETDSRVEVFSREKIEKETLNMLETKLDKLRALTE